MFSEEARFQMKKDLVRKRLLKYTRKAFRMLPQMDKPRILDVGCGSGVPTMELARLSNGEIIGLERAYLYWWHSPPPPQLLSIEISGKFPAIRPSTTGFISGHIES